MYKQSFYKSTAKFIAASLIIMLAMATLPARPAHAASITYYVDKTNGACNDSGGGTLSVPFCTIGRGAIVAKAGDTVIVLAGTYAETVKPSHSGAAEIPITFSAAPGVTVTGEAGNATNGGAFRLFSKSYIVVNGFTITGTADYGIYVSTSHDIRITNNHVSYSGSGPNYRMGIYLTGTTSSTITGNITDHNTYDGIRLNSGSNGNWVEKNISFGNATQVSREATGINLLANSNFNVIIRNITYANEDSGLNFYTGSNNNIVINNLTYGNGDHGIDCNASPSNWFIGNTVHGNVTVGINLEQDSPFTSGSGGATLMNNISVDNGYRRLVGGGSFTTSNAGNIRVDAQSTLGTTLDYNLVYSSTAGVEQITWGTNVYRSLAQFQAAVPAQEVHGLQVNPLIAVPAPIAERPPSAPYNVAINVGNYRLRVGSPAIDSANSNATYEQVFDIEGNPRVDIPTVENTGAGVRDYDDRGAYEYMLWGSFRVYLPFIRR